MDRICCVFDFQGFGIKGKFLVRELGWANLHNNDHGTVTFDLRAYMQGLSQKDQNTIRYNEKNIHGLPFISNPREGAIDLNLLQSKIDEIYNKCKRNDKDFVLYKGTERKSLLGNLPSLNLEKLGCPKYSELKKYYKDDSCGSHKNNLPCSLQMADAYRLWVKEAMKDMEISLSDDEEETDESE